ncbi:hypothetical protein M378DRAFT_76350 [Amanita muscaria Koide BX008]|uniref:Uncharacterized protein n=1 Tax=Amanita muscaria (strain Koide BX008) TaxID=946122 RepID=A0A0C2WVI1_AMAMK|nr:hypothetical protein M378DRAFT_76350 [Amanita muscaria Koide BX008]
MNAVESAAVMKRLREGIITYLDHIIPLLLIREQPFLPVPFPHDPTWLPEEFPHGDCFYAFIIQWNDAEHQVQHNFEVKLLHFRLEPGEQHVRWELVFKRRYSPEPRVQIGLLLVDRVIYEDQSLCQITGPNVLWSLELSVALTEPVHIRKITLASANARHTSLEVVRIYCNDRFMELARREASCSKVSEPQSLDRLNKRLVRS